MGTISKFCGYKDHVMLPITEADYDLDVSGAVSPFDRPGLGRWLKPDRLDQWDAICAAKLDRISRSLFDFTTFVHWLEAHDKSLIILDPELDLTTKEGRVMANILMTFAEYEREVIGSRVKDAYDRLLASGKYVGGMVPFGYRPVKLGKNWGFEIDPVYGPLVAEMARRFLAYESLGSIAKWLTDSGTPSPKDIIRMRSKSPKVRANVKGLPWQPGVVRMIISGLASLGAVTNAKGEPLRDEQGMVIYRAAPVLADDPVDARAVYEKVNLRISQTPKPVRVNSTPLLQIAFCADCGGPMHSTATNRPSTPSDRKGEQVMYTYRYYTCYNSRGNVGLCEQGKKVRAQELDDAVFDTLLDVVGHMELTTESIESGRDYAEDISRLIDQLSHLEKEIRLARIARKDTADLAALKDVAEAELDRLAAIEPEPAKIRRVRTGETFRQWWDRHSPAERNAFLRQQEVRAVVSPVALPSIDIVTQQGPLTGLNLTRMAFVQRESCYAVIYLGNLESMIHRVNAASAS